MSQTTVPAGGMALGVAGQIADSGEGIDIVSGFSQEAVNQIPFGYGLMKGPNPDGYQLPTGASGTVEIVGLSVFSLFHNRAGTVDSAGNFSGDMGASGLIPKFDSSLKYFRRPLIAINETPRP